MGSKKSNVKSNQTGKNNIDRPYNKDNKVAAEPAQSKEYDEVRDNAQTDKLTFYTAMSMIQVIVACAAAVLAMLVWARPAYYILEMLFEKKNGGYYEAFDMEMLEVADYLYLDGTSEKSLVEILTLIGAISLVVCALTELVIVVRAVNPVKKPWVIADIIGVVFAAAGTALFSVAFYVLYDYVTTNEPFTTFEIDLMFNMYVAFALVVALNLIGSVVNIFAAVSGRKRWKKDGRTY